MPKRKPIEVICGIIIRDQQVLVAQRSFYMKMPFKWEFPGGKRAENESDVSCLEREIFEELSIKITVGRKFHTSYYDYGEFEINLTAYLATYVEGTMLLIEHKRADWVSKEELSKLDWAAADIPIVKELLRSRHV
jgi:8-oxo-dGTP diphosphatase